ncbi:ABC transporter permease [Bryobacter aggregatus]|uniref:ABC transporter permease n=1 Tax=Bryobacter aggregatus TaxID=360054 RepID=UPI0004E1184D|nr:ABC transporter permease [Bryobacter aggregatus]
MVSTTLRQLRRSPSFTVFSILILALGIGSAVAIFSVVNALILRPLPYPHSDKIVRVMYKVPQRGLRRNVSGPDFMDWKAQAQSFAAMAAFNGGEMGVTVNGRGIFQELYYVTPDFFQVFEVQPKLGTLPDAHSAVIGSGFWKQHFGSSPAALGQTLKIDQKLYTIAGVMPDEFAFPAKAAVWILTDSDPATQNRTANNFRAVGRLKTEVNPESAQAELDTIAARIAAQYPGSHKDRGIGMLRIQDEIAAPYKDTLALLFGAAVLILLIACANVSSLTLAKVQARQREFAVRASVGATSSRIIGQVVLESLAIGLSSGAVGILLAVWMIQGIASRFAAQIDWRVVAFAALTATLSSLLFGLYPAWKVSRVDLSLGLKSGGQRGMVGGGSGWFRRGLAAGQVAISLVMLCGALLLVRSMSRLMTVDMGMDTKNVLVNYMHVPAEKLEGYLAATQTFREVLRELRESPQVASASAIMGMPTGKYGSDGFYSIAGQPTPKDLNQAPQAGFRVTAPGFFETMRIPLRQGRDFTDNDRFEGQFVAIINESLAKQSFPGMDPIGRQIICGFDSPKPMTIVGVVGDVRHNGLAAEQRAELYMPMQQHPYHSNELQVAIRAKGDAAPLAELARQVAARHNPDIAVESLTLESMIAESVAAPRMRSLLLTIMAGLALVLAAAGLYGVLAFLVSQRLPEFGLRVALGARNTDIVALVWKEAGLILGIGFAVGAVLVWGLGNLIRGFLFGVEARDPWSAAVATLVLGAVALLAALIPSLGATKADPMTVLRSE